MSTISVMVLVGAASGLIIAANQITENSKKNLKIAEIQSIVDLEANQLDLLFVDPVACTNTFGPGNTGGVNITTVTPAAPVNVANLIDGETPSNVIINTGNALTAYFPRNPVLPAAGAARDLDRAQRSQILLTRISINQGNNTGAPIQFVDNTEARDLIVAANQFVVVLNFQVDPVTNKTSLQTAGQNLNFFRTILINAIYDGGGRVLSCTSTRSAFFDQRYVNMKMDDRVLVPMTLFGRVTVLPIAGLNWTGYVNSVRLFALSDERKKENIHPLQNANSSIANIEGHIFDWKNGPKNNSGVIAQNIEKTFPDLVTYENGIKSVNYNSLIALSTAALKEELNKTQDLETSLIQMKKRVQLLKEKSHVTEK
ncbi:MAG: tail fiber domain-containing protein [Bdellovibrionales bacterium]